MPEGYRVRDGALWDGERLVETPEEADLFAALGLPWLPPERRTDTVRPSAARAAGPGTTRPAPPAPDRGRRCERPHGRRGGPPARAGGGRPPPGGERRAARRPVAVRALPAHPARLPPGDRALPGPPGPRGQAPPRGDAGRRAGLRRRPGRGGGGAQAVLPGPGPGGRQVPAGLRAPPRVPALRRGGRRAAARSSGRASRSGSCPRRRCTACWPWSPTRATGRCCA